MLATVATATIAVGITSCSSSKNDSSAPAALGPSVTAPAKPSGPAVTDSAVLQRALLAIADLPAGFGVIGDAAPPLQQGSDTPPTPAPDKSHTDPAQCSGVLAQISDQQKGAAAHAVARYGGADFASIDIDAASYQAEGAAHAFATVQSLFARCGKYSGTDADGVHVDYRLERLDQPPTGDASTAVRLRTSSEGFTLTSDVVIAVVGSSIFQLSATAQQPMDPQSLSALASKQADKLRNADGT